MIPNPVPDEFPRWYWWLIYYAVPMWVAELLWPLGICGEVLILVVSWLTICKADRLLRDGSPKKAARLYRRVAYLAENRPVRELVDSAQMKLEELGVECPPSGHKLYEQWLAGIPAHQRNVHLARQLMSQLTEIKDADERIPVERDIVRFLRLANQDGGISKRELAMLRALETKLGNVSPKSA